MSFPVLSTRHARPDPVPLVSPSALHHFPTRHADLHVKADVVLHLSSHFVLSRIKQPGWITQSDDSIRTSGLVEACLNLPPDWYYPGAVIHFSEHPVGLEWGTANPRNFISSPHLIRVVPAFPSPPDPPGRVTKEVLKVQTFQRVHPASVPW
jgi:hypothetical protein